MSLLPPRKLRGTPVKTATVVGFPLGANLTVTKLTEAAAALRNGAHELDAVINIGALKSGDRVLVQSEMRSLAKLAHRQGAILKVILETALLNQVEKILACSLAVEAGVDFVKTSTGFAASGATAADVVLMRGVVGLKIGVKAAEESGPQPSSWTWSMPGPTASGPAPASRSCAKWARLRTNDR